MSWDHLLDYRLAQFLAIFSSTLPGSAWMRLGDSSGGGHLTWDLRDPSPKRRKVEILQHWQSGSLQNILVPLTFFYFIQNVSWSTNLPLFLSANIFTKNVCSLCPLELRGFHNLQLLVSSLQPERLGHTNSKW